MSAKKGDVLQVLAEIFKALSDETRVQILSSLLIHGELCVCDVEGALGITQSKSSRHLRYLLHAGLVENRREGVWMHYRIAKNLDEQRKVLLRMLRQMLSEEQTADLQNRLERWFKKKRRQGTVCKAS